MKPLVYCVLAILMLNGCTSTVKSSKEQTYKLVISYKNGRGDVYVAKPIEIKEVTDSAAYLHALEFYEEVEKLSEVNLISEDYSEFVNMPTGFSLTNRKGLEIYFDGIETPAMKEKREKTLIEQKKVFAGAEFGMSKKQIKSLDYYKDWFRELDYLHKYEIKVGDKKYNGYLFFYEDKLYCMDIVSRSYRTASYYDTAVKEDVEHLRAIIESAYGRPTHNYGYPSFLKMKENYTTYAYVWEIGTKKITIGVSEEASGSRYSMRTRIENTEIVDKIKKEKEATDKKKAEEASKLF